MSPHGHGREQHINHKMWHPITKADEETISRCRIHHRASGIAAFADTDDLFLAELALAHHYPPVLVPFTGSLAYLRDTFSGTGHGIYDAAEERG